MTENRLQTCTRIARIQPDIVYNPTGEYKYLIALSIREFNEAGLPFIPPIHYLLASKDDLQRINEEGAAQLALGSIFNEKEIHT